MKIITIIALILCCPALLQGAEPKKPQPSKPTDFVHHPAPTEPLYISAAWYDELKKQVKPPPSMTSNTQKNDEADLRKVQGTRSKFDCDRANNDVLVSLKNFFGGVGPLDRIKIEKLSPFFEQIRNDGDYFIQKLKVDYPRKRPFSYMKDLKPCVPKEVTGAYPSGHAVLSRLYALILGDLYPTERRAFETRANLIASDRVLSGVHHPSDVVAGKKIGDLMHAELKKSQKYLDAIKVL